MILNPTEQGLEQEDHDIRKKGLGSGGPERRPENLGASERRRGDAGIKGVGVGADQKKAGRGWAELILLG